MVALAGQTIARAGQSLASVLSSRSMTARNLAPAQTLPVRSWYSLQRWRTRAKHQLRVDPLCCLCRAQGRITPATIADHHPAHGGDYNAFLLGPIRSLCKPCHDGLQPAFKHRGYSSAIGDDGYPIDPAHPFNRQRG
jgi:5-methylcytosine-specific restriction enzyme A